MKTPMAFMAGGFGWGEMIVVVLVVLLLFGAKRVPDLARSLGRSLSEFKKGREEGARDVSGAPAQTPPQASSSETASGKTSSADGAASVDSSRS